MSPNDSSIIAVICKYSNITDDELQIHLGNLEDPQNKKICLALLGRIPQETLDLASQEQVNEIKSWHLTGIVRRRNEQITARYQDRETRMAQKMMSMRDRGIISEEMLILYGISGEVPERHPTRDREYTQEEKVIELQNRMERRFGIRWRERFSQLPPWLAIEDPSWFRSYGLGQVDWIKEGF